MWTAFKLSTNFGNERFRFHMANHLSQCRQTDIKNLILDRLLARSDTLPYIKNFFKEDGNWRENWEAYVDAGCLFMKRIDLEGYR